MPRLGRGVSESGEVEMSAEAPDQDRGDAGALPPGTRIDDYEIRQWLGGGGFGITYLARDLQLDLPVAIKEFFPSDCAHRSPCGAVMPRGSGHQTFAAGLERFVDEARALANFRHPNIVRVLRHLRSHGTACIVMEYERGDPLTRWLTRQQPMSESSLLALVLPLLDGLAAVHGAGFLHRDIKPDNIYMRADGQPVLLDFGAARRVTAGAGATSIVSPGFAPFEQYHSQGEQGPWSDLYALGAVMYWMVTGRKPVEAAARIQDDKQAPPSQLAEPGRFGADLLEAIAWAMQPQAQHRPQSVDALREALLAATPSAPRLASGSGAAARGPWEAAQQGPALRAGLSASSTPACLPLAVLGPSPPSQLESLAGRNLLACIAFIDLVAWSAQSVDEQVGIKGHLNELLVRVLRGLPREHYLAMCTGDGAALCFLGDPEEALNAMVLLRDLINQLPGPGLMLRIGMHLGPVRVVSDLNNRVNVLGDGVNVAQRVMSFAQARELLVSGALHDCVAPISEQRAGQFRFLGQRQDKHGRVHDLYAVLAEGEVRSGRPGSPADPLMPRTLTLTTPPQVQEGDRRGSFPALRTGSEVPQGQTAAPPSSPTTQPWPWHPSEPSGLIAPELLTQLEVLLSQQLGPMARVLVRQQLRRAFTATALVEALAGLIDTPLGQSRFRQAAGRLLAG